MNYRSEKYLQFIREQPCCVSHSENKIVAHHVRIGKDGGMGLKPSDYYCIPLTVKLHDELHHIGEKTFFNKYFIEEKSLIFGYNLKYLYNFYRNEMEDWFGKIIGSENMEQSAINYIKELEQNKD